MSRLGYLVERECQWCATLFTFELKPGPRRRHCSRKCRDADRQKRRAERVPPRKCAGCGTMYRTHRKTQSYCTNECWLTNGQRKRAGRVCAFCWKPFIAWPSDPALYCSPECNGASRRKHRICEYCGEDFLPNRGDHDTYCSVLCTNEARAAHRLWHRLWRRVFQKEPKRYCRVCYREQESSRSVTCSDECGVLYTRMVSRLAYNRYYTRDSVVATLTCAECGKGFTQRHHKDCGPTQKYCSESCANRVHRRGRPKNYRQRARHYGVAYEPIRKSEVLTRDGWTCGICGGKIDRRTKCPHPKSGSVDHIVPMSQGGGHVWTNVQAAHFGCNSIKGDGAAGSQLLLVGMP